MRLSWRVVVVIGLLTFISNTCDIGTDKGTDQHPAVNLEIIPQPHQLHISTRWGEHMARAHQFAFCSNGSERNGLIRGVRCDQ